MKLCKKCGAHQKDTRIFCIDCGESLGDSLPQDEMQKLESTIEKQIDQLYNRTDPFYISASDKVLAWISLAGFCLAWIIPVGDPSLTYQQIIGCIGAGVFFLLCFINARFSKLIWQIKKWDLKCVFRADVGHIEPSDFSIVKRKLLIWGSFTGGVIFLILVGLSILNGPIGI